MTTIHIKTHSRHIDWRSVYFAFGIVLLPVAGVVSLLPWALPYKYLAFYLAFLGLAFAFLFTTTGPIFLSDLALRIKNAWQALRAG